MRGWMACNGGRGIFVSLEHVGRDFHGPPALRSTGLVLGCFLRWCVCCTGVPPSPSRIGIYSYFVLKPGMRK